MSSAVKISAFKALQPTNPRDSPVSVSGYLRVARSEGGPIVEQTLLGKAPSAENEYYTCRQDFPAQYEGFLHKYENVYGSPGVDFGVYLS